MAERALERLRKLADGNALLPASIQLFGAEENTYTIEGTLVLSPLFETATTRYAGGARGSDRIMVAGASSLNAEIERRKAAFEKKPSWISEAIEQLKKQPGAGWGLDDVKISLPRENLILAASEPCPTCQGNKLLTCPQCNAQGSITCPQCQGQRQEICHICVGSGMNPSQPGQPCINCNGMRYVSCRYCHGSGQLTCPTCHGRRGTVCTACNGAGMFTQEIAVTCGARTQFKINATNLPSGLRRGLDRLGIANLVQGHADIESITPPDEEEQSETRPASGKSQDTKKEKPLKPEIHFRAQLPYADLRMNFAGKQAVIGVFGKKHALLGVPAFLDKALEPVRDELHKAAKGGSDFDKALDARLMKDALKLQLAGVRNINALRRLYPQGLSPKVAAEILGNMRLALNRLTLRTRSLVAVGCTAAGAGIFAGIFMTSLHHDLTDSIPMLYQLAADVGILCVVAAMCWVALSIAIGLALRNRFPDVPIPLKQKIGKTGITMLAVIFSAFVVLVVMTPSPPQWLTLLVRQMKNYL